eukprot:565859-Pelagomonas_calceolata.AAC.1
MHPRKWRAAQTMKHTWRGGLRLKLCARGWRCELSLPCQVCVGTCALQGRRIQQKGKHWSLKYVLAPALWKG